MQDDKARRAADELAIRNVLARLAQLADDGDLNEYVSLFTEDGVWEGPATGQPSGADFKRVRKGHADLLAGAKERRAQGIQGPNTNTHHVVTNTAIQLNGDTATAKSFYMYLVNTHKKPEVSLMGVYNDTFRRTPKGWKMARRVITPG